MIKLKAVSVREKEELEPLLIANPGVIEEGLKIIAHQLPTSSGPLDILAVDDEGTLVVIELKNEAAETHLDQGLRYYDWCRENISWIADAYSGKAKIDPKATPRLMLVAPSFADTVRRIAKYIDADLDLIEYQVFENEKGEQSLICNAIDYGEAPVPPEIPSIQKKMEYFQSDKLKDLFKAVLDELTAKQIEIKPIHKLWASFWYRGKMFMRMAPAKKFFRLKVLAPEGKWTRIIRVSTREEWEAAFQEHVAKYMRYLDANQ